MENRSDRSGRDDAFLREVVDGAPEGIVAFDAELRYVVWNRAMEVLTGIPAAEILGRPALEPFPGLKEQGAFEAIQRALAGEDVGSIDLRLDGGAGPDRWVAARWAPHRDRSGAIVGVVATVHDVSDRRAVESALRESDRFKEMIVGTTPDIIYIFDLGEQRNVYANRELAHTLGYTAGEIQAMGADFLVSLLHPDDVPRLPALFDRWKDAKDGEVLEVEYRMRDREGEWHWFLARDTVFERNPDGSVKQFLGTAQDISERKAAEDNLRRSAHHDALTGLPNRLLLTDRIAVAIEQAVRREREIAVLYLDLDHFKDVNDTMGHSSGDRLLTAVAARLRAGLRSSDTVARVGGDEFVILLVDLESREVAGAVSEKVLSLLSEPFELDGHPIFLTASIGVSSCPSDGRDAETLLRHADMALYRAKDQGRHAYQLFTPEFNEHVQRRVALDAALRAALERGELFLRYQPRFLVAGGGLAGFEALVRWQRDGREIMPAEFIPLAEETPLIVTIGDWVLRRACEESRPWMDRLPAGGSLAVNVSPRQFQQSRFADSVSRAIAAAGFEPGRVELEITESTAMRNPEQAIGIMRQLRGLGVRVSFDDFGTGHASLGYLKRFPLDAVKIDQGFVRDLASDPADAAIVRAVLEMGHGLGLRVIAEGVETRDQLQFLERHGCDEYQGYLRARPLRAEEVPAFIEGMTPSDERGR